MQTLPKNVWYCTFNFSPVIFQSCLKVCFCYVCQADNWILDILKIVYLKKRVDLPFPRIFKIHAISQLKVYLLFVYHISDWKKREKKFKNSSMLTWIRGWQCCSICAAGAVPIEHCTKIPCHLFRRKRGKRCLGYKNSVFPWQKFLGNHDISLYPKNSLSFAFARRLCAHRCWSGCSPPLAGISPRPSPRYIRISATARCCCFRQCRNWGQCPQRPCTSVDDWKSDEL